MTTDGGPVVEAGVKVREFVDRGLPQDVIGVHAACRYYSVVELEQLGGFDPYDLRERLESVVWVGDEEFAAHGLTPEEIADLRRWALDWESDLGLRLLEDYDDSQDAEG
ncbi:hypothetical protein OIE43_25840 [Streptomyces pseudovenezuelae]|uniref:Uncharacterized protein n=1 Tax=Streptomyces pseudovenezuelae TaxID=67350 RepID=A0A101NBZ4_9ACTN|nr:MULTISPECIES: hypothetical protein [Streptomyces]KUM90282.1 hypothetical protein AQI94_00270 [Streptomyces pseudovenezuelae]